MTCTTTYLLRRVIGAARDTFLNAALSENEGGFGAHINGDASFREALHERHEVDGPVKNKAVMSKNH